VLTDCNRRPAQYANLGPVYKIFDHHQNESAHPEAAEVEIDEGLGSACTLIAELLVHHKVDIPPELSTLLLGTILVDSRNFCTKENRFNERDVAAVRVLENKVLPETDSAAAAFNKSLLDKWFSRLMEARYDVSSLGAADLLKLDYKEVASADGSLKIGFSSIFDTLPGLCNRAGGAKPLAADIQVLLP
jgi:inorganic pyrophosphatase/exopolyphosphatase